VTPHFQKSEILSIVLNASAIVLQFLIGFRNINSSVDLMKKKKIEI